MKKRMAIVSLAMVVTGWAAFRLVAPAGARAGEPLSEEFHHTYFLAAEGRLSLASVNGDVHIRSWDRNEVQVDARKSADSAERLADIRIEIEASPEFVNIKTRYSEHRWRNNPGRVDYNLTVPKRARIRGIELVNGNLDIQDVTGSVDASSVNGRIHAAGLAGNLKLSAVNGRIDAAFDRPDVANTISISSVNGSIRLDLPPDVNARLSARTVTGEIRDEFGLPDEHGFVGHHVQGMLGNDGGQIELKTVNGEIEIRKRAVTAN